MLLKCPNPVCEYEMQLDSMLCKDGTNKPPEDDDIFICIKCGCLAAFTENCTQLRAIRGEEFKRRAKEESDFIDTIREGIRSIENMFITACVVDDKQVGKAMHYNSN